MTISFSLQLHEPLYVADDSLDLLNHSRCLDDPDAVMPDTTLFAVCIRIIKSQEVLLEICDVRIYRSLARCVSVSIRRADARRPHIAVCAVHHLIFLCQLAYPCMHLAAHPKEAVPLAPCHRKNNLAGICQQILYDAVLDRRKAGEAVQHYHAVSDDGALMDISRQHVRDLLQSDISVPDEPGKCLIYHAQVMELVAERAPYRISAASALSCPLAAFVLCVAAYISRIALTCPAKLLRSDAVLIQLGYHGLEIVHKACTFKAPAPDLQLLFMICRNAAKDHRLRDVVDDLRIFDAQLLKYTICQPIEAQHLDIVRRMVGMQTHDLLFSLGGCLLRHQHYIMSALQGSLYTFRICTVCFPAPARSEYKSV